MKKQTNCKNYSIQTGREPSGERLIPGTTGILLRWVLLMFCILLPVRGFAINLFNPAGLGLGLVMTHHDDPKLANSGLGGGFHFYLKYQGKSNQFLNIGTGFYTITDDVFEMDHFQTTVFPSMEILYGLNFGENRVWIPSVYFGLNLYAAFDKIRESVNNRINVSERFFQTSGVLGLGLEIKPNYLYSIFIDADYRYVFLASENNGRHHAVVKFGFLFYQ